MNASAVRDLVTALPASVEGLVLEMRFRERLLAELGGLIWTSGLWSTDTEEVTVTESSSRDHAWLGPQGSTVGKCSQPSLEPPVRWARGTQGLALWCQGWVDREWATDGDQDRAGA